MCLITQGEEVAPARGAPPEFAKVGTCARIVDFDMPQLGILHVATRGEARFQVQSHAVAASGLVTGEVTTIAPETPLPLAEGYAPLARLLELIASRVGPQNFPAERDYGDASWVGYRLAELLPLPLSHQAEHARDQRRRRAPQGAAAVPHAAGTDLALICVPRPRYNSPFD